MVTLSDFGYYTAEYKNIYIVHVPTGSKVAWCDTINEAKVIVKRLFVGCEMKSTVDIQAWLDYGILREEIRQIVAHHVEHYTPASLIKRDYGVEDDIPF